jgi:predicted small metal-binding protein
MTSPDARSMECPCCDKKFETIAQLITHMKTKHSENEILEATCNPTVDVRESVA